MASYSTTTLLLLFCAVQFSYGQVRTESVKIPLCNSYDATSFTTPNVFNHTSQDEAIHHMHTFAPLVATFCHNEIVFFLCMVHIPQYRQPPDAPPVFQPVCRSLCDDVYTQCKFAMDKLNFHWPDEISCGKFPNTSCISGSPWEDPFVEIPDNCSYVSYSGGSPICSSVISAPPDNKYFIDTNNPFTNYFGHKTQQEAMFELSTHGKLINLLISQQPYVNRTNEVTQCLNNIRFLLCNLYLPRCRYKTPSDFPITSADCKNTLERNCSATILQLQNRGYNITWPPVNVDCDKFPQNFVGNAPLFKSDRTFGGLSPPPPAVIHGNIGPDFLEVKWNSFPEEYKFGTTVETGILYRKSGSRVQYNNELARTNSFTLRGLNSSTTYEILVGTVNSNAMYPGTFEEIKLKPAQGVERIKLGFCSSLYNFTKLPNIFGHKTQDEAINSAHKFGPLLDTGCSSDLKALICSAHFPNYLAKSQTTQFPCRSLCERVSDRCSYPIDKLNFLWPKELNCENLPQQESCYQPSPLPKPIASDVCEHVQEQSICSLITRPNQTSPYFATVEKKFKNYFNHTSQEQAVYELSKHSKLLSLLSTLIAVDPGNSAAHTTCVQKLAHFLCSFYLPNCRAGIEISQADCKSIVGTDIGQQHVCSQSVFRLQRPYGFAISWPPVQVNCNSISASVGTPKVGFNEIRFQDILPPPPAIRYSTISEKRLDIIWLPQLIVRERVSGYEFLFKPSNTKIAYNLFIHFNLQVTITNLTADTSKDYEVFVAVLDSDNGMPGYFQRILYTAGSTVYDLPLDAGGPCERYYPQTVLPNSFGDSNITTAKTRLYPFYPLIHTLCSEELAAFLCSVIFPRYYFGQQRPCQSVCKKIRTSCSYATSRTKFFWPQEFTCDRDTFEVDQCFDVTKVSANQNPPPIGYAGVIDVPSTLDICYNYYRKASLPNMYGDKIVETAKQRFLPFYPLVHTFCSSELETFMCSVFFPRYDSVRFISQKPCRKACERVYGSCKYAIGRSKFFWPPELECSKFSNDATCYNLKRDVTLPNPDGLMEPLNPFPDCKPTPSTPICSNVLAGSLESPSRYFRTTFQYGNYFGHDSTDEAVYELSKFANLMSSLLRPDDRVKGVSYRICYLALTILLCHLHLPVCPRSPLQEYNCLDSVGNTSVCFDAIKDLNSKGANFAWPPVKVNCENNTWFRSDQKEDIISDVSLNNQFGPPAPRNVQIIPRYSTRLIATYNDTVVSNTTALYRRLGTTTAYQTTTINPTSGFGTLTLEQLMPATDYEIKLARLRDPSGLPGPFETHTSNTFGQCQNDTTGDEVAQGKILWTAQDGNTTQTRKCPYGDNGLKAGDPSRSCECDVPDVCKNPFWLEPYTIRCNFSEVDDGITLTLSSIAEMLSKNELSPHNACEELVVITSQHASEFTEDDLVLSTLILENIVQDIQQLSKNGPNIVKAIDNLLNTALNVLVDSQKKSNATARIVVVLDQFLENIPLKPGQNFTQNEANIAVYTQEYDPRDFEGAGAASIAENAMENLVVYDSQSSVQTSISQVSLTMPKSLFRDLDIDTKSQNQRISFAIYRKTSFFTSLLTKSPTSQTNTVRRQNSFVVSGSVKGLRLTNLTDPIRTTYEPLEPGVDETTACVFWNFTDDNGIGDWSPVGCSFQGIEDGIVTCHCTHLTNFAILMDVHIDDRDDDHDEALSIISYIGCAISLVGLILTIITVLIFKDLRSKAPTQILLNFCIALSLTLIVFLAAAERSRTSSLAACRAAAIALHYFVLAMFVWTSIQAYNMYLAFVKVMPRYHSKFILKCCVVGWGLPAVIVIIAAASAVEEYGDENFCRVQGLPFQIGFLAPVVLILVVNSIAFALIIRSLLNAGSKVAADKRATGLQHARRGAAILVVLGLTWLFGVLAIRDAKLVFQYLFCIFNSIQGLLVFIFYCVLSSETKAKYRKLLGGKSKESDTSGKHRYPGSSSEAKFREINLNKKKSNVYTTNSGSSSLPQTKHDVEMARM